MRKCAGFYTFIIFVAAVAIAAPARDFSGTFIAKEKKAGNRVVIRVVQSTSGLEVTKQYGDKSTTNHFPLDGSEGDYTTGTGARGKCKAQMKNDTLVLEYLVSSPSRAGQPSIRFDTREQWKLSSDGDTLTIKTEIASPDMPAAVFEAAFPNNPWTEKYQRTDKP